MKTASETLGRIAFDEALRQFRQAITDTIQKTPHPCPFLETQPPMLDSLRFQDRLYDDLNELSPYLTKGNRILDIGTGSGIAAFMLASQGYQVDGIDIDCFNEAETHLHMGEEQKLGWQTMTDRLPHLRFQHYYNSRIPFDDSTFDVVVAYGVIEHVPEPVLPDVMRDIFRVTKPGGYFMISYLPRKWALLEFLLKCLGRPHHLRPWGDREIRQFLSHFGYSVTQWKRVIYAPQFPASFANRHKRLFDALDKLAGIPPFSLLARDLSVVSRKK